MVRRIVLFCTAIVALIAFSGCALLTDPDVDTRPSLNSAAQPSATETNARTVPSPEQSAPEEIALEAEPTPDPPLAFSEEEVHKLFNQVVRQLMIAAYGTHASEGETTFTVNYNAPSSSSMSRMWCLFLYLLAEGETPGEEIFGEGFVRKAQVPANEIPALSSAALDPNEPVTCEVITAPALQEYFQNAFGMPVPADLDGNLNTARTMYIIIPADYEVYVEEPISLPTARDVEQTGVFHVECSISAAGPDPAQPWGANAVLNSAPESPYMCHVTSLAMALSGTPATAPAVSAAATPIPPAAPAAAAPVGFDANGFVFADSSQRYLTDADLRGLSPELLAYARNEIFARNGNIFKKDNYKNYYSKQSWYTPIREGISPEELSAIEQANIRLIQQYEKAAG